jgi:hypothetical protein
MQAGITGKLFFHVSGAASVPLLVNWLGSGVKFTNLALAMDAANLIVSGSLFLAALGFAFAWWRDMPPDTFPEAEGKDGSPAFRRLQVLTLMVKLIVHGVDSLN